MKAPVQNRIFHAKYEKSSMESTWKNSVREHEKKLANASFSSCGIACYSVHQLFRSAIRAVNICDYLMIQ